MKCDECGRELYELRDADGPSIWVHSGPHGPYRCMRVAEPETASMETAYFVADARKPSS